MPSPLRATNYRVLIVCAVAALHLLLLFALSESAGHPARALASSDPVALLVDLPKEIEERSRMEFAAPAEFPVHVDPPEVLIEQLPSRIDWAGESARTAASAAQQFNWEIEPVSPAPPRKKKPFAWDKTHTQRVESLPEGGISIRLSDRCSLVLAPFPLGGCTLGKIEARGDLFESMDEPVEFGDWKSSSVP